MVQRRRVADEIENDVSRRIIEKAYVKAARDPLLSLPDRMRSLEKKMDRLQYSMTRLIDRLGEEKK